MKKAIFVKKNLSSAFMFTVQIILSMPIASCPKRHFRTTLLPYNNGTSHLALLFSSYKLANFLFVNFNIPLSCSLETKFLLISSKSSKNPIRFSDYKIRTTKVIEIKDSSLTFLCHFSARRCTHPVFLLQYPIILSPSRIKKNNHTSFRKKDAAHRRFRQSR